MDDDADENDRTIVLTTTVSGLAVTDVTLTVTDTAGVTVSVPSLSVAAGATATYTVVLDTKPAAAVTVAPTSGMPAKATASGPVVFGRDDWKVAKTITVRGVAAGDSTVTHAVGSDDPKYPAGLAIDTVAVAVTTGICDRTPAVRDTLVALFGYESCGDFTARDLADAPYLDLRSQSIATLKATDFHGLSGVTSLNLYGNAIALNETFDGGTTTYTADAGPPAASPR